MCINYLIMYKYPLGVGRVGQITDEVSCQSVVIGSVVITAEFGSIWGGVQVIWNTTIVCKIITAAEGLGWFVKIPKYTNKNDSTITFKVVVSFRLARHRLKVELVKSKGSRALVHLWPENRGCALNNVEVNVKVKFTNH